MKIVGTGKETIIKLDIDCMTKMATENDQNAKVTRKVQEETELDLDDNTAILARKKKGHSIEEQLDT